MVAAVAWISVTPVKGLRLQHLDGVRLDESGVPGDRAFFVVDERGVMVSASRLGPLVAVVPEHDAQAQTLSLRLPGGEEVAGRVELGEPEPVGFYRLKLRAPRARPVLGSAVPALRQAAGPGRRAS